MSSAQVEKFELERMFKRLTRRDRRVFDALFAFGVNTPLSVSDAAMLGSPLFDICERVVQALYFVLSINIKPTDKDTVSTAVLAK